ncbi:MAG: hypothetical protein ACOYKR_08310 [Sphingobacterium thalpophilum]
MKIKISKLLSVVLISLISILISCSKQEVEPPKLDLRSILMSKDKFIAITQNVSRLVERNAEMSLAMKKMSSLTPSNKLMNYNNQELEIALLPLVESGKLIHFEMVRYLQESGGLSNLSEIERQQITNLDDSQLAALSFTIHTQSYSVDWGQVRSCASMALGFRGISELWTNTLALGSVETTMGALKLLGRRYLGWLGVALMIYDFQDCMGE